MLTSYLKGRLYHIEIFYCYMFHNSYRDYCMPAQNPMPIHHQENPFPPEAHIHLAGQAFLAFAYALHMLDQLGLDHFQ